MVIAPQNYLVALASCAYAPEVSVNKCTFFTLGLSLYTGVFWGGLGNYVAAHNTRNYAIDAIDFSQGALISRDKLILISATITDST